MGYKWSLNKAMRPMYLDLNHLLIFLGHNQTTHTEVLSSCLRNSYVLKSTGEKTPPFLLSKRASTEACKWHSSSSAQEEVQEVQSHLSDSNSVQGWKNSKESFKRDQRVKCVTFSKCCWRWHSTWALAAVFPTGMSAGNFRGVPISSSASAPRKTRSSKSPTVRTYSSYSLFTALLEEKPRFYLKGQAAEETQKLPAEPRTNPKPTHVQSV